VLAMAPLDAATAEQLLSELRLAKVLDGVRGAAPCDRAALVRTFVGMGALARDLGPLIAEMDLNPVLVSAAGAIAVDCLIVPRRARPPGENS
jgi:acetate---CoA ligase (ADP-forming)